MITNPPSRENSSHSSSNNQPNIPTSHSRTNLKRKNIKYHHNLSKSNKIFPKSTKKEMIRNCRLLVWSSLPKRKLRKGWIKWSNSTSRKHKKWWIITVGIPRSKPTSNLTSKNCKNKSRKEEFVSSKTLKNCNKKRKLSINRLSTPQSIDNRKESASRKGFAK